MFKPVDTNFVMTQIVGSVEEMRTKSMQWLDSWLMYQIQDKGRRGALIFDIDETVTEIKGNDEVLIKPVANLYKKYRDMGIPVYFVTARPNVKGNQKDTEDTLRKLKLNGYKKLYLMSKHYYDQGEPGVNKYKFSKRTEILDIEKDVMARVGDMTWDSLPPSSTFKNNTSVLRSIKNEDCYIIFHPKQKEVSIKLPG